MDTDSHVTDDSRPISEARSDPAAFARLYRRHYDAVFRYCVHRLFERQAAEDVTSAVFLKVVENFNSFKGTEKQFRSWLYKIATNAVNNHLRRSARQGFLLKRFSQQAESDGPDCEEHDANTEKLAILKMAVLALKPKYQTVITLRFFENLKLTEIAEVLGRSPGTVRSQLARALAKLKRKIASQQTEVQE